MIDGDKMIGTTDKDLDNAKMFAEIISLKEQLSGYKRMQAECNIANRKLRKIKEQIKIFWKAEKADDSFDAIERIEKILEEQECQEQ